MKTDKLFYQIFINQQSLIHELLPDIPHDCQFEYTAPVVKETEFPLDGLLTRAFSCSKMLITETP